MRIAVLIKQVPAFEEMELGPDGRLRRDGLELEMNPYCRRAVSQAVELAANSVAAHSVAQPESMSSCTFVTLAPPSGEDVLREALAWALERGVEAEGVLVTDRAFAGSDTLATARALAATLEREGPFDLVLVGRNSVDADTGQVGPELAELLDLPFLTGVRHLHLADRVVHARCEHDDGWVQAEVVLPAILSTAERLIEPCKVDPPGRAAVPARFVRTRCAQELGPGPWGQAASPTRVGHVRVHEVTRERLVLEGSLDEQAEAAVELLIARGALDRDAVGADVAMVPDVPSRNGPITGEQPIAVVVEPHRPHDARELLGTAARLAVQIGSDAVAITFDAEDPAVLASWGADAVIAVDGAEAVEEDAAYALARWAAANEPWGVLVPSTSWGREVSSRAAAALGAGLTGDAVGLEVDAGRLVAWKPAFGGQLVAAITASSPVQMATVRVGVLPLLAPRPARAIPVTSLPVEARGRVKVLARTREDDLDALAESHTVVGVGQGVDPAEYHSLGPLLQCLGAELGATRKVTDQGWLPRARQIGITGRSIAPRLYIAIGASGKFNHMVGVRAVGTVLAINSDPAAPVFAASDIGIIADWHDAVPALVCALVRALEPTLER
ncbi:MAG TPA: FAD-binding protein [Acidimicrobiia bacterium]